MTTSTNGHAGKTTDQLREEYRRLRLESRLVEARANKALMESWVGNWPSLTGMGPGQFVDPLDRFRDGNQWLLPMLGRSSRSEQQPAANPLPSVQTEVDLDRLRAQARWLLDTNGLAQGVLTNLRNFVVRQGFRYRVVAEDHALEVDPNADALAQLCDELLTEFRDRNDWTEREKRGFWRSRRDGELFLRYTVRDGLTTVRTIEPEDVRQPSGSPPEYSWGIRTGQNDAGQDDVETRVAYAAVYGPGKDDWEEVKAEDVDHLKLNTDECVKRGLSDFFSTWQGLDESDRLLRSLTRGATIQACIAGIRQFEQAGRQAVEKMQDDIRSKVWGSRTDPQTGTTENLEAVRPGTIWNIPKGTNLIPLPWVGDGAGNHLSIYQARLRSIGARWCMPEYMVSGDVSNTPFASNLVAGSPFVVNCETEQSFYKLFWLKAHWRALKALADAGRLKVGDHEYSYDECKALLDVECTPPQVAIQTDAEKTEILEVQHRNGIVSKQTWRGQAGYDSDREKKQLQEEPPPAPQQPGQQQQQHAPGLPAQEGAGSYLPAAHGAIAGVVGEEYRDLADRYGHEAAAAVVGAAARLLECGGEGGKPGPCPEGKSDDRRARLAKMQAERQAADRKIEAERVPTPPGSGLPPHLPAGHQVERPDDPAFHDEHRLFVEGLVKQALTERQADRRAGNEHYRDPKGKGHGVAASFVPGEAASNHTQFWEGSKDATAQVSYDASGQVHIAEGSRDIRIPDSIQEDEARYRVRVVLGLKTSPEDRAKWGKPKDWRARDQQHG
jgi:hypothetical protein